MTGSEGVGGQVEATKGLWAMVGHLVSVLSVLGRRWRAWGGGEHDMFQSCMESGLQVRTGPLEAWLQGSNVKGVLPEAGAQTLLAVCAQRAPASDSVECRPRPRGEGPRPAHAHP